jgi:putative membrane protein
MPSERRLHPLSFLFTLGRQARNFLLPGVIFFFSARRSTWAWELWGMLFFVPVALASLFEYFFFRYRYDAHEMVIRSGLVFRNERHIPYARIQNIDARQNVLHRLLRVAEVRVETGGGQEAEATLTVLPVAAFEEMRRRVFEEAPRAAAPLAPADAPATEPASPPPARVEERALLALPARELALAGLVEGRGMIVIAAALGALWETGVLPRLFGALLGQPASPRSAVQALVQAAMAGGPARAALLFAAAGLGAFVVVRLLSMAWAVVRLHGFTLARAGGDLRVRYGLFTRVTATIPLFRIQTVTVHEGVLHRAFGRVALQVDTAGGGAGEDGVPRQREWLAPVVRRDRLPALLREIAPELDAGVLEWRPLSPRAFRRAVKPPLVVTAVLSLAVAWAAGAWALAVLVPGAAWSVLLARRWVRGAGYAVADGAVAFRSGWLLRRTTMARFAKVQVVSLVESPFDRRAGMAAVHVDTAGASVASHRVQVPYLDAAVAQSLFRHVAARAAGTAFRW